MPRTARKLEDNRVYHVYNRRTDRQLLFPSADAQDDFLQLMAAGRRRYDIRICSYCLMDTHWHQAIWVGEQDGAPAVTNYLRWLEGTHALHFRYDSGTRGEGHVYQDRYKARLVEDASDYLTLVRYIEANPVSAGLVARAERWPWSSLTERLSSRSRILVDGPVPLPSDWVEIVNARGECVQAVVAGS